jgi:Tfp pilus assembly protein FimT
VTPAYGRQAAHRVVDPPESKGQEVLMSRSAFSLVELLLCLGLIVLLGAMTTPGLSAARDAVRADGASNYVAAVLHGARAEALKRRSNVAVRFEADGDRYVMAIYLDGDGNGVLAADISNGTDGALRPREPIDGQFPNVAFGFESGVPDVDGSPSGTNPDPIRLGRSRMLSFSPSGTSSAGTVYLRGPGRRQTAVRVLGATGRIRTLRYDFAAGRWVEQ